MRKTGGAILVALAIMLASGTVAQAQGPSVGGIERTRPMLPSQVRPPVAKSPPVLFWLGPLPVRMWAPVQPSYDATANRTPAENPWWLTP